MISEEIKIARVAKAKATRERNKALKKSIANNLREQIALKYPIEPMRKLNGLSLDMFLILKALLVPYLSDKNKFIAFLNGERIFTSEYYTNNIFPMNVASYFMSILLERDIISIDPSSPTSAFSYHEGIIVDKDLAKVSYRLNIENIEELLSKEDESYDEAKYLIGIHDIDVIGYICSIIFEAEVTDYLNSEMHMLSRFFECDYEKHIEIIINMLKHLSVEQCFNLITMAVKGALYFGEKNHCTKKHTINIALSNLTKYLEKSLTEGWTIKAFDRGRNNPKSIIRLLIDEVIASHKIPGVGGPPWPYQ